MSAERIRKALELMGEVWEACLNIRDAEACEHCPFQNDCLNEDVFLDVLDAMYVSKIEEMFDVAYKAENQGFMTDEEWTQNRIDEEANLRRSELDD